MRPHNLTGTQPSAGLYIHIPFCHSKCSYCDFYSKPLGGSDTLSYVEALLWELNHRKNDFISPSSGWRTVYIGGGTPSILPVDILGKLVEGIGRLDETLEFTIEANPEDITRRWLEEIAGMGIGRVSMGVQSFDDCKLAAIGRRHTARRALESIEMLKASHLEFSLDLIYGLPGQSVEEWCAELKRLLQFNPPHFSAYLLSFEPGTRLTVLRDKGRLTETSESIAEKMYGKLCEIAADNGYEHYEISNFAMPGHRSVHNSAYWNETPYLGIGPGAHSFNGVIRSYNPASLKLYLEKISARYIPAVIEHETETERINDIIITTLRTADGLDFKDLKQRIGPDSELTSMLQHNIQAAIQKGMLKQSPTGSLIIPEHRWLTADATLRSLIL